MRIQNTGVRIQNGKATGEKLSGFKKKGKADKGRFMNIAQGSLEECRYYLILAKDLGYGDSSKLMTELEEVSNLLESYSASILNSV